MQKNGNNYHGFSLLLRFYETDAFVTKLHPAEVQSLLFLL